MADEENPQDAAAEQPEGGDAPAGAAAALLSKPKASWGLLKKSVITEDREPKQERIPSLHFRRFPSALSLRSVGFSSAMRFAVNLCFSPRSVVRCFPPARQAESKRGGPRHAIRGGAKEAGTENSQVCGDEF